MPSETAGRGFDAPTSNFHAIFTTAIATTGKYASMVTSELEALALELNLPGFDLLLVGDGSGSTVETPCGWFATLYDRNTNTVVEYAGCTNHGTNNYAELAPYIHALWAYQTDKRPLRVSIVSDSEVTVKCGNGEYARRANGPLWASIAWFEQNGYIFNWRHVRRNTNLFSKLADRKANEARKLMLAMVAGKDQGGLV